MSHLDIPAAERLEQAIRQYDGTVLLISHDRMLLQDTVEQLLIFDGEGGVRHFLGTWQDYLDANAGQTSDKAAAVSHSITSQPAADPTRDSSPKNEKSESKPTKTRSSSSSSSTDADKKSRSGPALGHLRAEDLEQRIIDAEARIKEIDASFADTDLARDGERVRELREERNELTDMLAHLEQAWEQKI